MAVYRPVGQRPQHLRRRRWLPTKVSSNVTVTAPAGVLTLAGDAPTIRADDIFTSPAGALVMGASAPVITLGPVAPAGVLTLAGNTTTILLGPVAPTGALVLGASTSSLTESTAPVAPAGNLVLDGIAATVSAGGTTNVQQDAANGWVNYYH
jgi:hypothetical protein